MKQKPHQPAPAVAASLPDDLVPTPAADNALVPQESAAPGLPACEESAPPALDAHGFDPAEYQWLPVRRKPRKDGWTPQRQQDFIAALADTGCVEHAAMRVSMTPESCYRLRRAPGAEGFSAAWDVALQHAARVLLDTAFERAFNGSAEPVFDREGMRTGTRFRHSDRLMMFLLRAYMPERFRHANRDWRGPDEALPPSALAAPPIAETLRLLEPVPPAPPHTLMAPDELEDAILVADILPPGELPLRHRGKGDAEPVRPVLSAEAEAELERIKHPGGPGDLEELRRDRR